MIDIDPVPAEFFINDEATVAVTIVAAQTEPDVALTLQADPAHWETIDLLQLFQLRWDARHEGVVSGERPVWIEIKPASDVDVDPLPDDPAGLAAFVAAAGGRDEEPWRDAQRWYALSVTEAVDLPPELAALGEVRSGFATVWADAGA